MNVMCPQPSIAALIDLHSTDDDDDDNDDFDTGNNRRVSTISSVLLLILVIGNLWPDDDCRVSFMFYTPSTATDDDIKQQLLLNSNIYTLPPGFV